MPNQDPVQTDIAPIEEEAPYSGYFATLPTDQIGKSVLDRVEKFYKYCTTSGRRELWRLSHEQFYAGVWHRGHVLERGAQGELLSMEVNHYHNFLQHLNTMTTSQRPSFDPRAINTDYKSMAQTILAAGLIDYYNRQKRMEVNITDAVNFGTLYGEGWIFTRWDEHAGDPIADGEVTKAGDVKFSTYAPMDVIRDVSIEKIEDHNWFVLRDTVNKYDLAMANPQFQQEIIDNTNTLVFDNQMDFAQHRLEEQYDCNEIIATYTLIHKRSPALPNGRMTIVLEDATVIFDGDLPYDDKCLSYLIPQMQDKSPFGYTIGFDLLPIQEAATKMYSTILTNNATFGVQNILVPRNINMEAEDLGGGLRVLEFDAEHGKPEPMQFTATAPETYNFCSILERLMETVSAVNSVVRGNPEASLKSGAALALIQAVAIQFSSGLQAAYGRICEDTSTALVRTLKKYATTKRVAAITGKNNRAYLKEFSGDDLSNVDRVIVDLGNPLSRTLAGRVNLADSLLEKGMLKTPEEYTMLIQTGRIEPILHADTAEMMLIISENEAMMDGKPTPAISVDIHPLHIKEHKVVLASPDARANPDIVKLVTDHMMEHIALLSSTDPALLAALGIQAIPPAQAPQQGPAVGPMMEPGVGTPPGGMPNLPNPPAMPAGAANLGPAADQAAAATDASLAQLPLPPGV